MTKAKKITINDLGEMIKEGFDGVDKRFDKVENRLDNLERSMEEVKLKFAYVAWAIDVEELKKRVDLLEQKVGVKKQK
jgi:tetrahydromethanopterin S-methyltransferase subunit G